MDTASAKTSLIWIRIDGASQPFLYSEQHKSYLILIFHFVSHKFNEYTIAGYKITKNNKYVDDDDGTNLFYKQKRQCYVMLLVKSIQQILYLMLFFRGSSCSTPKPVSSLYLTAQ